MVRRILRIILKVGRYKVAKLRRASLDILRIDIEVSFYYSKNIYYNSGNVGIGTNNPTALLDLVKPTAPAVATDLINMRFDDGWGLKLQQNYTAAGNIHNIQYDFIHRYNSVNYNALTFKGANVGIGTTNPQNKLEVNHDLRINASGAVLYFGDDNTTHVYRHLTSQEIRFVTGNVDNRMIIAPTGNVAIGTTNVVERLNVGGSISLGTYNTTSSSSYVGYYNTTTGNDCLAGMEIENTTLTGNYSQKLHLRSHHYGTSNGRRLTIHENGNVVIGGNLNVGSLTNPSDSRIKKDIEDINDATALNKLLLIQPTTYNYIDEERNKGFGKVYGFIAQQIREVIPEAAPIIEYIIPNIYKSCLINNKREVYHSIPLNTPIDTEVKIRGSEYKIKEIHEDYFVIDKDIDTDDAFVFGYSVDDFHTLNKDYIFTLNVCATQELHRRIEAQSVLLKSQDDRIKDLETKVAVLLNNTT